MQIDKPFVADGWLYACDGRIAIRLPAPGEPDSVADNDRKFPGKTMTEIFNRLSAIDAWAPWPAAAYVERVAQCDSCEGWGRVEREECSSCHGSGEVECTRCYHTAECDDCLGKGVRGGKRCTECAGQGEYLRPFAQPLGTGFIQRKFDLLIRALPGVEWAPSDSESMFYFRFEGGAGAVMEVKLGEPGA
jgi:hypothetical protein